MTFGPIDSYFSQHRKVRERREKGLHPVNEMDRFYILICCFFCSVAVSITYAFDLFTETFQTKFGLSSGDLTTVSTVGLVFGYFTIPYSLLYENFGPFTLFCICFALALAGGLCLALTIDGYIAGNTATITIYNAMLYTASGLIDTAYISTLFEIFPRNRGPVVCLAKVMTSLGSSVLACLSENIFTGSISSFIYFLMALCMFVSVWAAFTVVLPPYFLTWWRKRGKTEDELMELRITEPYYERKSVPMPRLIIGYIVVTVLIIFFTVETPVVKYAGSSITDSARRAIGIVSVILLLSIFAMILPIRALGGMDEPAPAGAEQEAIEAPYYAKHRKQRALASHESSEENIITEPTACVVGEDKVVNDNAVGVEETVEVDHSRQDPRYEGSFFDYLKTVDLWLIMLLFICYGCLGTLVLYNASSISIAINGTDRNQATSALYTAFLGVGSSLGRIAFGLFEAYVQHQDPENRKILITMALPLSPTFAFIAGLLLLTIPGKAILLPYLLVYFEEGVFAGVNALIFPCLFERHHNSLYNLSFLIQCVSIVCFNRLMFGVYSDKKLAELNRNGANSMNCNVMECVRMPLIVSTCLGFCGIFVAVAIHIRYSRFVRRVWAERRAQREAQQVQAVDASVNSGDLDRELVA